MTASTISDAIGDGVSGHAEHNLVVPMEVTPPTDPYYIHLAENPNAILVTPPLTSDN